MRRGQLVTLMAGSLAVFGGMLSPRDGGAASGLAFVQAFEESGLSSFSNSPTVSLVRA